MKPAALTDCCTDCGELMPYDPNALNQLCNSCNRLRALGGLPRAGSTPSSRSYGGYRSSHTTTPLPAASNPGYGNTYHYQQQQPAMTPPLYGYTGSPQSMMASPSLKRKYDIAKEELQYPNKRPYENAYAPYTPSTTRNNEWPPTLGAKETNAYMTETDDEGGEEFVDAPEDQGWEAQTTKPINEGGREADAEGEIDEDQHQPAPKHEGTAPELAGEDVESDAEGEINEYKAPAKHEYAAPEAEETEAVGDLGKDRVPEQDEVVAPEALVDEVQEPLPDDDDLFTQNFGANTSGAEEITKEGSDNEDANMPTAEGQDEDFNRSAFIDSLNTNSSTKAKPKRKPFQRIHPLRIGPIPIELPKHLGWNLKKQHTFHDHAINFVPRLPLALHRYWIGVLKIGVPPRKSNHQEKNFTWMKGNRLTTIETVWRAYCTGAAEDENDIVLLLGFERPALNVRAEELDYFNDKRIILRAVRSDHKDAKGRGLAEELIKEIAPVIDLEAEGEDGGAKKKEKKNEKEGEKKTVFIEID